MLQWSSPEPNSVYPLQDDFGSSTTKTRDPGPSQDDAEDEESGEDVEMPTVNGVPGSDEEEYDGASEDDNGDEESPVTNGTRPHQTGEHAMPPPSRSVSPLTVSEVEASSQPSPAQRSRGSIFGWLYQGEY